jgi:hypothetical protein
MKKFSVVIALVLLAVAGTGYAVTCAYDNVPAATLLVPYWRVGLSGVQSAPIPSGGVDTLVSIVNVSTPGVIAHVTVWNKYSKAVIDFNLPLTGKDVVSFSMRNIMNGLLSPNSNTQCDNFDKTPEGLARFAKCKADFPVDPCGLVNPGLPTVSYEPSVGFGQTQFIRFSHPDAGPPAGPIGQDVLLSISQYNLTLADAIGAGFRSAVWDSLDESGDITTFTTSGGANILDKDNPACQWNLNNPTDNLFQGALSGYLTIDVVNYCTNFFPEQGDFYNKDAIATVGWGPTYTPNTLIGDVFYVDQANPGGNISGDQAVAIEFDARLPFTATTKTFFGKFVLTQAVPNCPSADEQTTGCSTFIAATDPGAPFRFPGDGREPLGDHYGFRYLADSTPTILQQTWLTVWRSDLYAGGAFNLCAWANPTSTPGAANEGLYDTAHQVSILTYDNDENLFAGAGVPPGPSGQQPGTQSPNYIFLETQRINLLNATDWNPQGFKGGWIDLTLRGPGLTGVSATTGLYNMGWAGVEHSALGQFVSVGYAASNLNGQFQCSPNFQTTPGVQTGLTGVLSRSDNPR